MTTALALAASTLFTMLASGPVAPVQDGRAASPPSTASVVAPGKTPQKNAGTATKPDTGAAATAKPQDVTPALIATTSVAIVFVAFIGLFIYETTYRREEIGVNSHWGGFGGGLGGWHAAPSLFYFVGAILFGAMLTILASGSSITPPVAGSGTSSDTSAKKAAGDTTKKSAGDTTKKGGDTAKKKV